MHGGVLTVLCVLCSRVEVATCSVHGTWYLWDIKLRRAVRTGNCAGAASIVRFTPHIHTLTPPRPLLVTAHWSAQKRESSVHLWDIFDPESGRGAAPGAAAPAATLWHSFMSVAGGQVQDVAFTVDSSAEEDKVLMALAALDGSLVVLDLAARSVMTHMTGGHTDVNRTSPSPRHSICSFPSYPVCPRGGLVSQRTPWNASTMGVPHAQAVRLADQYAATRLW